ncbi:aminotransferase class I/II-fold pyridoxal phosphate-dependent enzyme [Salinivibrio sp. MA607]|uniref:aminotransferase class I/II-fold pyridoxal phosphate-dependent enzyme n=1 Tax=Salinivibrio sp. MA607 TaxID=1909457 RepID=UPI0009894585|nr:aminotransferase class I/II-fold pyridoxal phosphate-dependent enzyme [Salinivibrio sp. MA607]OOF01928.1 hypothetical protein BZG81_15265 [Salinivibrio sp. MA607]
MLSLEDLCIDYSSLLREALIKIDNNAQGLLFVVDDLTLLGVLTDGDIRRAIINGKTTDSSVIDICNKECQFLSHNAKTQDIQALLSDKIKLIPLVDEHRKIVDFASSSRMTRTPVLEPLLGGNELEYITKCITTNWISSQGKYVTEFENSIKNYTGSEYVLSVSNGTVALHLSLVSLGVGPGDEVIVPDITFGATLNAVILAGAKPVIVDVNEDDWNICTHQINKNINKKTKAIMPVHIYGVPCNMKEIINIAEDNGLLVIEDCAEALGSTIDNKHVGTFGNAGTFSFFGNKVITCGEGGAVIFRDEGIYNRAKILRDHGMTPGKRYWHECVGFNYRLTNLQAAVGCAQFEQLSSFREKRMKIFSWYKKYLLNSGYFDVQKVDKNHDQSYWLFTAILKDSISIDRDSLSDKLAKRGIDTRPVFYPMSQLPAFQSYRRSINGVSERIAARGISLPTSVSLEESEIKDICIDILATIENFSDFKEMMYDD